MSLFTNPKHRKQVFPKVIWEERVALARLHNKVPSGYNGTPQIHPTTAPSIRRSPPYPIPTDPTHRPKRHPDPLSHFATIQFSDTHRQTDTHTDTQTDRQMG